MSSPSKTYFLFPNAWWILTEPSRFTKAWENCIIHRKFSLEKHLVLIHHHRKEMKQVKCTGSWQQTPFTKKKCYDQLDPNWAAAMSCLLEMHFFVQQILHSVHEAMKNAARLASCSEENRFSSLKENCLERYYSLFTNVFIAGCRKLPCTGP